MSAVSAAATLALAAVAGPVWVGRFSGTDVPSPWRVVRLDERVPPTVYRGTVIGGVPAIEARANESMALLARPLFVDLQSTPILCWRWRIDAPVGRVTGGSEELGGEAAVGAQQRGVRHDVGGLLRDQGARWVEVREVHRARVPLRDRAQDA